MKKSHFALILAVLVLLSVGLMAGCGNPTGGGSSGSSVKPWIYCGASADKNISIISGTTNTMVGSIELSGRKPYHIAASIDGKKLYVSTDTNEVIIIDTARNKISGLITIEPLSTFTSTKSFGMAVSSDGKFLYFICESLDKQVRVYLQGNNTYESSSLSTSNSKGLILNETGTMEMLNDGGSIRIMTTSPWILDTFYNAAGILFYGFALKDGKVYAAASPTNECYIINSSTGALEGRITAEGASNFAGVVSIPGKNKLYVSQKNSAGALSIINTSGAPTFEPTVITGESFTMSDPTYMAATANGKYVYVMDSASHTQLCLVDTATDKVVRQIPINYVASDYDNNVVVLYK